SQDVSYFSGAKGIDGLRVVADHGQSLTKRLQGTKDPRLQQVGILVLVDEQVIEPRANFGGEFGICHQVAPVEQQVVVIQRLVLLFSFHVSTENRPQFLFPVRAPRPVLGERIGKWFARINAPGIDGEAGILFRKPPGLCSEPEFEARDIQQVGSGAAVKNRKTGVEPEIVRVTSQYAIRYRVEGAGPWEAAMVAKLPVRYRIMKRLTHDRFHPPGHLERGATGERQ